jgi:AcrR family transcriptional regulator
MSSSQSSPVPIRPRRRRRDKEESRRLLLKATFALLSEGQALTTVAVTRRAGLSQSAFYVHFADMDTCTIEAIREVIRVVYEHAEERQGYHRFSPMDRPALERHLAGIIADDAIGDIHRVFSRYVYESGAAGDLVRGYFARLHAGLLEDLWHLARVAGVPDEYHAHFAFHAELVLASIRTARASVREGRAESIDLAAKVLTRNFFADFVQAVRECGGHPERIAEAYPPSRA